MTRLDWDKAKRQPPPERDARQDWWLVPARKGGRCSSCSESADTFAYNHGLEQLLCQVCAESLGVWKEAKPSRRLLAAGLQKPKPKRRRKSKRRQRNVSLSAEEKRIVAEARAKQV